MFLIYDDIAQNGNNKGQLYPNIYKGSLDGVIFPEKYLKG